MHFMLHKVFSPVTHLGFGVWGTPGSRGWVGRVMLVLRTFPELVWRSVQNLVKIDLAVRAWKGDIGRYILQTVTFIYRDFVVFFCVILSCLFHAPTPYNELDILCWFLNTHTKHIEYLSFSTCTRDNELFVTIWSHISGE